MADELRIALAQMNAVVGDIEGNAAKVEELGGPCPGCGRAARRLPRADAHGLPARGPAPQARLPPPRSGGARRARRERHHRRGRLAGGGGRARPQRRRRRHRRRGARRVPQAAAPELRGVRRAPLVRAGQRPGRRRRRRHARRDHYLRGHLGAGADRGDRGGGRTRGREPVGVALPPRQGDGARAPDRAARARQRGDDGVLQPRRRSGRARLRRTQPDRPPRWRGGGPRPAVRRGARPRGRRQRASAAGGGDLPRARDRRARLRRRRTASRRS